MGKREKTQGSSSIRGGTVHYDLTRLQHWKKVGFRASFRGVLLANLALDFMCYGLRNGAVFQCGGKTTVLSSSPLA